MTEPSIHNWGRWGEDDQLGALNLQSPESVLRALQLVRQGKIYNLAVPLEQGGPQAPAFNKTWQTTYITTSADPDAVQFVDDVVIMESHSGTHLDALGHVWTDGVLWNGVSDDSAAHGRTLDWGGIDNVSAIFSRGVMLDIAKFKGVEHLGLGEVLTADDMQACADAQGVEIQSGDVLLVRTGWRSVFDSDYELWQRGGPGPDISCAAWLQEKDVMAVGADNVSVEANVRGVPSPTSMRLHIAALRDLGIYLIELMDLDELAADEVYEFLFIAAPLRLTKATGSPMTPIAVV